MSSLAVKFIIGTIAFFMLIAIIRILWPQPSSASAPARDPLLIMLLTALIGTVLLGFGLVFGATSWSQVSGALRTEGVVVSLKPGSRRRQPTVPVVRYEVAGQSYQSVGSVSFRHDHYWVGEVVQVAYRPDRPEAGTISSFTELWAIPVGCAMAALFPYSICFALWRARRRLLTLPPATFDAAQQG